MTYQEFHGEIAKLIQRFDKKYYPDEVIDLIFREVNTLSYAWLKKTVAPFLGQHRAAVLPEFREAARIEKERLRVQTGYRPSFHQESMFTQGQVNFLFDLTKRIARRQLPNQNEFIGPFNEILGKVIELKDRREAHSLFKGVSKQFDIPYTDNDGPEAS